MKLLKLLKLLKRQNLAKSSRAFLIAYDEQPDLAKFCPEPARQNLAKSNRAFLEAGNYLIVIAYDEQRRFGQILPADCPGKIGQIEPLVFAYDEQPDLAKRLPGKNWPNRAASF